MQTLPQDVVERVGSFLTRLELHLGVTDWTPADLAMLGPAVSKEQFDRDIGAQIAADKLRDWCRALGFQPQLRVIHASIPGALRNIATIMTCCSPATCNVGLHMPAHDD